MESDYGSRTTLGWVREADTVVWPTRQGYVINRARADAPTDALLRILDEMAAAH